MNWETHDFAALFLVTAAIIPPGPPPPSLADPFFLPFLVGICTPAEAPLPVLLDCDVPPELLLFSLSNEVGIQMVIKSY